MPLPLQLCTRSDGNPGMEHTCVPPRPPGGRGLQGTGFGGDHTAKEETKTVQWREQLLIAHCSHPECGLVPFNPPPTWPCGVCVCVCVSVSVCVLIHFLMLHVCMYFVQLIRASCCPLFFLIGVRTVKCVSH